MTTFTRDEARTLTADREGPLVSILMPVHEPGQLAQQDRIRLRNHLREARNELGSLGLRTSSAEQLLAPLARLLDSSEFWSNEGRGLALFAGDGFFRAYRVPTALPDLCVVADAFHVKPLLPLLSAEGVFYVLALSDREARLLRCTREESHRVELPELAAGKAALLADIVHEPPVHAHGSNRRATAPHAVDVSDRETVRADFFRAVDRAVREVIKGEEGPLILACVAENLALWSRVTSIPTYLAEPIPGNWDETSDAQLRLAAWPRAQALFASGRARDRARYESLRGSERATNDLPKVLRVARQGQVDTLFVPIGTQRWGRVDRESGEIGPAQPGAPGALDLLNEAAIQVLRHGGMVHATPPEQTPDRGDSSLNAILRW